MKVLAVIAAVALFGLVGQMDYEDAVNAVNAENHYCDMVKAGNWPAYRDDIVCSKVEGK